MKKELLLVLASTMLLASCTTSNKIIDNNNHDEDITDDVTDDGEDNDFDDKETEDENVETPSEYGTVQEDGTIDGKDDILKYYLKGTYPQISITANKNTELYIFLDGVTINSTSGIAFGSSKAIKLHLVILNNSENTIVNDVIDTNAFHVKGDVLISGNGTLNIESKQKHALKVSKNLYVYEGVTINAKGYEHAIAAQSITTNKATLNLTSETKDGIQLECDSDTTAFTEDEGFAYLVDTNVSADTYGDGIQADTYVYISGGTYDITTHGQFVSYSSANMSEYGLSTDDFKFVKSGSTYKRVATDEIRSLNSSYYALTNSVKGIKAGAIEYDSDSDDVDDVTVTTGDYKIYIAHLAKLTINSTDDCVHTNYGSVTIENANLDLTTLDDGLHADYDLAINNASISVLDSYEGLEGANITIDGEDTNLIVNSQDDGINAAGDLTNTHNMTINNGYIRIYAAGDGLDANTALYLNGGTVIVEGPGRNNGSLDSDKIYFNGGIVMALSTSGMRESMSAKQYTFVWQGTTIAAGTKVSVVDSNNVALFSYTLKQSGNQIIFSHPDMKLNESYKLMSGSTTLATIKMTSTLVTSGTSGGGHGPGGW